jgi:mRNA-degrading endonuclease RelE of RelBE toxin-antitoxin system
MKLSFTKLFIRDYQNLPWEIQLQTDKQLELLLINPLHPSLQTKKMKGKKDIWEGRITQSIRFSFKIEKDIYILRRVGPHNKVLKHP